MYSILVTAQKCSFHRITLESSHRFESSLVMTYQTAIAVQEVVRTSDWLHRKEAS